MNKNTRKTIIRIGAWILAILMVIGSAATIGYSFIFSSKAEAPVYGDIFDPLIPAGYSNVAPQASITVSNCSANKAGNPNSYEMPTENWSLNFLTDGTTNKGWSTDPYDKERNRDVPVTLDFNLQAAVEVASIALFPNGSFPVDYQVLISSDGKTYSVVADVTGASSSTKEPVLHAFTPAKIQYVRITCTRRGPAGADGALVQLGEVAIFGKADITMQAKRPSIELLVGETDTLSVSFTGKVKDTSLTWSSADSSIVSVDKDGKVTARKLGQTTITATCPTEGLSADFRISVVKAKLNFDENIMLSIFWPPTPAYINDEQYKLIADAGVNWILGAGEETLATAANQQKMLELAAKYGLHIIVNDGRFGGGLINKNPATIASQVEDYKNVTALGGFYILDEPLNANGYVDAYVALKKAFPEGYMHLNFLPSGVYGSETVYRAQMNDWCRLCAAAGYPVDYLIYDRYPFGLAPGSMDRNGFYANLRSTHDVGLANQVRTGTYIQTVCQSVAFRRPTDSEIRYEMYSALAFGFKQLSFFTWFTPVNRSEPFEDGIISADGKPNAHYETIKTINHEILAIGPTLVMCEAEEVYLNGRDTYGQPSIPKDFFVQPGNAQQSYTLSWMRHKETSRNYLMVVNNNFQKAQTIDLVLDPTITGLYEVSKKDGSLSALQLADQKLQFTLAAGDAIFLALPEGVDFLESKEAQPSAQTNLALDSQITCSESRGSDGYYMYFLNDGARLTDGNIVGWRSNNRRPSSIVLDLKYERSFNRMDLYPAGTLFTYGESFPSAFTVSVSTDGTTYKEVAARKDCIIDDSPVSVTFSEVKARYIRIDITACKGAYASLCEIEVYNDDGTVPAPAPYEALAGSDIVIEFTEGQDLALRKPVYPSSTTPDAGYRQWGWAADFVNDGSKDTGWTSNVKQHNTANATEYTIIDLQDIFAIDKVEVLTRGVFPEDFRIEMSTDGRTWSPIVSVTGSESYKDGQKLSFTPDGGQAVVGRYLRFIATRLRGTTADGYMLQLGNISAYGTPVCDTSVITTAMQTYKSLDGDTSDPAYVNCANALDTKYLTQSQANALAKALLSLVEVPVEPETDPSTQPPVTEPATEPETEPAIDTEETSMETVPVEPTTTGAPTQTTTDATDSATQPVSNDGCQSVVGATSTVLLATAGLAAIKLRKKKKEE